jgi:(2Fe-2S) ferredoxin
VVIAYPEGIWYRDITPERGREIVRKHVAGERLDEHMVYVYDRRFVAVGNGESGTEK